MSTASPDPPRSRPPRNLHQHHRQTERRLVIGFVLILLIVGGGLIAWSYGWAGLAGGLVGILACILPILGAVALLWFLLTWAGRWADRG